MKKAGYIAGQRKPMQTNGATTNLGETLRGAMTATAQPASKPVVVQKLPSPPRGTWATIARATMAREPDRWFTSEDICKEITSRGYEYTPGKAGILLAGLVNQGDLIRGAMGQYKHRPKLASPTPVEAPKETPGPTAPAVAPPTPPAPVIAKQDAAPAAAATATATANDDLAELDAAMGDALAALDRVDRIVRRCRPVIQQAQVLKSVLERMK